MNGWWWTLIVIVVWIVGYQIYNRGDGKHRDDYYDGFMPTGSVYYVDGTWYTISQNRNRCERLFHRRSNPLDHEVEWETVEVPPRYRKIPHEVEYS